MILKVTSATIRLGEDKWKWKWVGNGIIHGEVYVLSLGRSKKYKSSIAFQQEYIRGISAWHFDLEDLKTQAALIEDYDGNSFNEDPDCSSKQKDGLDDVEVAAEMLPPERVFNCNAVSAKEDELNDLHNAEGSLASFPILPLQALKNCFDVDEDEVSASGPQTREATKLEYAQANQVQLPPTAQEQEGGKSCGDNMDRSCSLPRHFISTQLQKFSSGSLIPENVLSSSRKVNGNGDRYIKYSRPLCSLYFSMRSLEVEKEVFILSLG
ncbi:hypothetical protein GIB67_022749 [Kingdonia uniflora]|uniref:Uncharacterized protein n=1 Tax=Kingdonia uniflora TaxID=39325 RepID=A0A7J7NFC9_9MAGN|nr:hypothetical protein GIB67_022749 [Kingdonia uniflora]